MTLSSQAATTLITFPDWDGTETADITLTGQTVTVAGADYTFDLLLDGTIGGGASGLKTHADNDAILMRGDGTTFTDTLIFTVSNIVETTTTGQTISYDGLTAVGLTNFNADTKSFTADRSYLKADGPGSNAEFQLSFDNLVASKTIDATGTANFRVEDITLQFNTIPEPSSAALLGLGGLALILRRRK